MEQIDFLQQVAFRASELRAIIPQSKTREWKLNYKMLFNPKLHCPFCEEWIESGRVWIVDEVMKCVKRVWKLDGTRLNVDGCHPHVGAGGRICMGSARSTSDALVAGIAGTDDFVRAWDWFPKELGHTCEVMDQARASGRFNRYAEDPFEDDHEGELYCECCDSYYPEGDSYFCGINDSYYCEDCWSETHNICDNCSNSIHTHADESTFEVEARYGTIYVCEVCYDNYYFTCTECDKGLRNEKHQEDGVCVDCWAEDHSDCRDCGSSFENDELDAHGLCEECQPDLDLICSECEVGTQELIDGKCRTCYYGTGEGQLSLLEEASDGSI